MDFYTQWNRPEKAPFLEYNEGPKITDPAHVPAKAQIENMMAAGMRLKEYRREMYHFGLTPDGKPEEVIEDFFDPQLEPNFDLADASAIISELEAKEKAAKEAVKLAKKKEADMKKDDEALKKDPPKEEELPGNNGD